MKFIEKIREKATLLLLFYPPKIHGSRIEKYSKNYYKLELSQKNDYKSILFVF